MKKSYLALLLLPGLVFLAAFMVIPILLTVGSTFYHESRFTIEGYLYFFKDPYFLKILWTTLRVSLVTTALCMLLGFPTAYFISQQNPRKKCAAACISDLPSANQLGSPFVQLDDYFREKRAAQQHAPIRWSHSGAA